MIGFEDINTEIQGKYYLKKFKHIPSEYILKRYYNGGTKEFREFFENNQDEIFERAKSTYILPQEPIIEDCLKNKYINKTLANAEMKRIQEAIIHDHKPVRSYYCTNCSHWHLTSKTNEILEKYENKD